MNIWKLAKNTFSGFSDDQCLSQGAAIAYYTIFSLAPVLIIVIAVAGLVFGQEAARGAIVQQLAGLMGQDSAQAIQTMINGANNRDSGILATAIGVGTLIITASGVFSQMQTALNQIWKAKPNKSAVSRLVRARIASLGLVVALGFLLIVSLVISAALAAFAKFLNGIFPGFQILMMGVNFLISLALISLLFGAIYKVLPDKPVAWRDVMVGAVATGVLFTIGKMLIGFYIGRSHVASTYGGASAFVIILLWIYYSAQIFLLGAEFTRTYAETHGSHSGAQHPRSRAVGQMSG